MSNGAPDMVMQETSEGGLHIFRRECRCPNSIPAELLFVVRQMDILAEYLLDVLAEVSLEDHLLCHIVGFDNRNVELTLHDAGDDRFTGADISRQADDLRVFCQFALLFLWVSWVVQSVKYSTSFYRKSNSGNYFSMKFVIILTMEDISQEIIELEARMNEADFWNDKDKAQETIKRIKELKDKRDGVSTLDKGGAIMSILAGAGGDDSEDFARMLFEMYDAYFKRQGYSYTTLHDNRNDHGGFRNITIEISGKSVYGNLKNESGVHRLVRISPFNAQAKRHTSFAMVEVLPIIPEVERKTISPDEIRIETSKASGPGGQNVNKRETAVRVIHIPTNISVHVATERQQEQNRQKALEVLAAKLYKLDEEKRKAEIEGRQISKTTEIEWGNQIRSYVLHPYKMVKDHRTDFETSNVEAVLEKGEIEGFIEAEKSL